MMVNDSHMHCGYMHVYHSILVMVTCMIDVSLSVQSYARALNSHAW